MNRFVSNYDLVPFVDKYVSIGGVLYFSRFIILNFGIYMNVINNGEAVRVYHF